MVATLHQLPTLFNSHLKTPAMATGPRYIASEQAAQKTPFPTVVPLLHVTQPLPSNGCFSGFTVIASSKYAMICIVILWERYVPSMAPNCWALNGFHLPVHLGRGKKYTHHRFYVMLTPVASGQVYF